MVSFAISQVRPSHQPQTIQLNLNLFVRFRNPQISLAQDVATALADFSATAPPNTIVSEMMGKLQTAVTKLREIMANLLPPFNKISSDTFNGAMKLLEVRVKAIVEQSRQTGKDATEVADAVVQCMLDAVVSLTESLVKLGDGSGGLPNFGAIFNCGRGNRIV